MSTEQNYVTLGKGDLTIDAFGYQVVAERYSLFHGLFTYDVSPKLFHGEINGTEEDLETSTQIRSINGRLAIDTIASNGDTVVLESRRHPRYQPNRAHHCAMSIGVPNPIANAIQDWGMFTDENGVFFRCGVDGELYACIQSGGVLTHEEKITLPSSFSGSGFDVSKGNNYDIEFQWRGVGDYLFFIENPKTTTHELIHRIKLINTLDESVSIENPALPIAYRCVSLGDVGSLWSGCADITSSGGKEDRVQYQSAVSIGVTVGTDTPIIVLRQPETIGGSVNTRDAILSRITISSDKRAITSFWTTRDPTAITGGSYVAIGGGSFVEANYTMTAVDTAKLNLFHRRRIEANATAVVDNPDHDTIEFFLIHGDYLVITGSDGGAALMDAVIEWGEEI